MHVLNSPCNSNSVTKTSLKHQQLTRATQRGNTPEKCITGENGKMKYLRTLILLSMLLMAPQLRAESTIDSPPIQRVVFYNHTFSPAMRDVFADVMQRIMHLTVPEFGPFEIVYYNKLSNGPRMMQLVSRGDEVHVFLSAPQEGFVKETGVSHIPVPFISAILGLRMITVQRNKAALFENITNRDSLAQLRVGLGYNWAEKSVFSNNLLPYGEAIENKSLLPMLKKGRFDYITASALDNQVYDDANFLTLNNPLIYYPVPIYMHVSERHPDLVKRLKIGLQRFMSQGEAATLIQDRLQRYSPIREKTPYDVIVLTNPFYSAIENQDMITRLHALLPEDSLLHLQH